MLPEVGGFGAESSPPTGEREGDICRQPYGSSLRLPPYPHEGVLPDSDLTRIVIVGWHSVIRNGSPFIGASGTFFVSIRCLPAGARMGCPIIEKDERTPTDGAFSELIGLSVCEL